MSKVSRDEAAALAENLPREWQAILTSPQASVMSPPPKSAKDDGVLDGGAGVQSEAHHVRASLADLIRPGSASLAGFQSWADGQLGLGSQT